MEPGRPGHGSPGRRVYILGRVGSGHGSVSITLYGATKMYFLSTGALSLSACLAQAAQVCYQQFQSMFFVVASCRIAKPLLCCMHMQ